MRLNLSARSCTELDSLNERLTALGEALHENLQARLAYTATLSANPAPVANGPLFSLTFWNRMSCTSRVFTTMTAATFRARIKNTKADSKDALPSFSAGRFGRIHSKKRSLRHMENLCEVTCIVGDHDAGTLQPWQAAALLKDSNTRCLIYTTASHRHEAPRWRVVAPTARRLPPTEYRSLADRLDAILGGNVLADESRNPVQFWFFGSIAGQAEPEVFVVGAPGTIDEAADPAPSSPGGIEDDALEDTATTSPLGLTANVEIVGSAVATIPNDDPADWESWNRMLLLIHAATDGSDEGKEIARAWSAKNPAHDDTVFEGRWAHFRSSPPTRGGAGSLFHIATQHGWKDPRHDAPPDTGGDLSNSRRLAERMVGRFLFDRTAGRWCLFNGVIWVRDRGEAMRKAQAVADALVKETSRAFADAATDATKRAYVQALQVYKSAPRIEAMLRLAHPIQRADAFSAA